MMLLADDIAVVIVMIVVVDVGLLGVGMRMARTVGRINWCLGLTIIMTRSGAMPGMTSAMDKGRCSQVGNSV